MSANLKRDQIPQKQAQNWRMNFSEEEKLTFSLLSAANNSSERNLQIVEWRR